MHACDLGGDHRKDTTRKTTLANVPTDFTLLRLRDTDIPLTDATQSHTRRLPLTFFLDSFLVQYAWNWPGF